MSERVKHKTFGFFFFNVNSDFRIHDWLSDNVKSLGCFDGFIFVCMDIQLLSIEKLP